MPDKALKVRGNDPRFAETTIMRGDTRLIEVRVGTSVSNWQWKTDGVTVVVFYDPQNKRYQAKVNEVLRMTDEEWQEANEALRYEDDRIPVTPADILDYIKRDLLGIKS